MQISAATCIVPRATPCKRFMQEGKSPAQGGEMQDVSGFMAMSLAGVGSRREKYMHGGPLASM